MARKNKVVSKTRRSNNEGCITQRKDGRWAGIATIGYDENGKQMRKTVYGKTRMEVVKKLTELTNRISNDNLEYIENNTFGNMMKEWLLIFKKQVVSGRTFEHQFRNFKLHIEPQIGKMKIDEVNTIVIQKLLNELLEQEYSLDTTRKIKFLISQFFEYAIENNLATDNPARKAKVKSSERKIYDNENRYKAIPIEVREKFIEDLNKHDLLKPFCLTMLFGGLRVGEVLALRWENVDFKNKTLNVEFGVTQVPKFDDEGNVTERVTVVSDTKTACSVREVPLPDILIKALEDYKKRQWLIGKENNVDLLAPEVFIFANNDGSVRSYSGMKSILERFLKAHELDKYGIHFHGLRHTYSNMLFENNENPKVIQALLGHKSVKTTITTYNSVDKSYFKRATDLFNREFAVDEEQKLNDKEQEIIDNISDDQLDRILELLEKRKLEQEQQKVIEQDEYKQEDVDTYEQEREERRKKKKQSDMEM